MGKNTMRKKLSLYWKCMIGVLCIVITLNIAAISQEFCDWYVEHVFPIGVATYGRIAGWLPFSLGEYMIIAAIILGIAAFIFGIVFVLFYKKERPYIKYIIKYYQVCLLILMAVVLIITMNFRILYGCSKLEVSSGTRKTYSVRELEILRNYLVEQINQLSDKIERDDNGIPIYKENLQKTAKQAMLNLAKENPRLSGFYPDAKPIQNSRIMSMIGISGVYFSFSLEANYNNEMYSTVYPETICHEYAHLKGYILENEANYIGYLACVNSEDIFFQYSGYMSVFNYVEWAYLDSVDSERFEKRTRLNTVAQDDCFTWLDGETEEEIYGSEDMAVWAENLTEVRETVHDASLKLSGVEEGLASYDRVTELLLQYYDGKLY